MKTAQQIRKQFLEYFKSKEHKIVPSAPLVIKNDPTLMFTNAGMNQFKEYFLGTKKATYNRVANSQKCLRVSGKHNDLDEVGVDTYHHTMFEMLGNWSFGNYFKKEAIAWAWDFLVNELKLDPSNLYVTVFKGNKEDQLKKDEEAITFWKEHIDPKHILMGSKKDNFWEMGETGPCGPCTEIHYDNREENEKNKTSGKDLVNKDHPQVIEIWNIVFIEYERMANSSLKPLPQKHVDTGMGFERLVRVIQNKSSNYDTDIFMPLIQKIEDLSNKKYGTNNSVDVSFRVIADHIRAITFTISDGQLPSNNGAGYVIRRILRRAVRYGYTFLNFKKPFLSELIPILVSQFQDAFPNIKAQESFIEQVVSEEESHFFKTLETGLKRIEELEENLKETNSNHISGKDAFELYDTYGFPFDLTLLIAKEKGLIVDEKGFNTELNKQKQQSRNASEMVVGDWNVLNEGTKSNFIGYSNLQSFTKILRYREVKKKKEKAFQIVLEETPFYAESGGQVGDTGVLSCEEEKLIIFDTLKENGVTIHFCKTAPKHLNQTYLAKVNDIRRKAIEKNHTATHLLHEALRKILGKHVEQRGSLVNENYLRFDFSHFQKMSDEELKQVEQLVNKRIKEAISLKLYNDLPLDEAKKMGAMALFGEKYDEKVRVVQFDSSIELCGGCHVKNTNELAIFKIVSENSIQAGVRRIEAWTSNKVIEYYANQEEEIKRLKSILNNPKDIVSSVEKLQNEKNILLKKLETFTQLEEGIIKNELKDKIQQIGDIQVIISNITISNAQSIKNISFQLQNEIPSLFLMIGAKVENKAIISIIIDQKLLSTYNVNANDLIKNISKDINGGGGGQAFYATAGGKNPAGIKTAIEKINKWAKDTFSK